MRHIPYALRGEPLARTTITKHMGLFNSRRNPLKGLVFFFVFEPSGTSRAFRFLCATSSESPNISEMIGSRMCTSIPISTANASTTLLIRSKAEEGSSEDFFVDRLVSLGSIIKLLGNPGEGGGVDIRDAEGKLSPSRIYATKEHRLVLWTRIVEYLLNFSFSRQEATQRVRFWVPPSSHYLCEKSKLGTLSSRGQR